MLAQYKLKCKYSQDNKLKVKNEFMESIIAINKEATYTDDRKSQKTTFNVINIGNETTNNIPNKLKEKILTQIKSKAHLQITSNISNDENNDPENKCTTSISPSRIKLNSFDISNKQVKTCSQCSMTFKYRRHLYRHLEGHEKNNCLHCNAKFARRKHLEIHLFRSHGQRVRKYLHSCDVCTQSFPKRILLNRHRAKHTYENGKVCSDCGDMLKADQDDEEHHCTKKQYQCKRCLQTFGTEQTYLTHMQNHDNYKCSSCDITFASKRKMHEHYKMVHSSKLYHKKIPSNGNYFCNDCRHSFLRKDDYFSHLDSISHIDTVNKEISVIDIFECTICSKKFISQRALAQHIRRIHRRGKRFTCNIYGCTFQCARKSDLGRHKQLHVEQRNIICEQCGKTFTSISILNDHVLYIHNKEREFICEECGKTFKRNSLLKRHKLSHQQYRPFVCIQCGTAFKRSHHLTRHLETCHRIQLEKKEKVIKLMKTEDGHLVPVLRKTKEGKIQKVEIRKKSNTVRASSDKSPSFQKPNITNKHLKSISDTQTSPISKDTCNNSTSSLDLANILSGANCVPHVLSLLDVNLHQIPTVEASSPKLLIINDFVNQLEPNCNEILNVTNYEDMGFQNGILCTDHTLDDHPSYSELPLGTVKDMPHFVDSNVNKVNPFPIENGSRNFCHF